MEEYNKFGAASLITRSTNDVTQVQMFVVMGLQMAIKSPILAVWAITKIAGKNFTWTMATGISVVILLIMMGILLAVGTFMDPTPAILIFTPIFLPIVTTFGVDPLHFGTMIVYNLCVGVITPPVGNVLFIGSRVAGLRIEPVVAKLAWFLVAIIVGLFIVVFVPPLSLWLPTAMGLA